MILLPFCFLVGFSGVTGLSFSIYVLRSDMISLGFKNKESQYPKIVVKLVKLF